MSKTYMDTREHKITKYDPQKDYDFIKAYFNRDGTFSFGMGTLDEKPFKVDETCYIIEVEGTTHVLSGDIPEYYKEVEEPPEDK